MYAHCSAVVGTLLGWSFWSGITWGKLHDSKSFPTNQLSFAIRSVSVKRLVLSISKKLPAQFKLCANACSGRCLMPHSYFLLHFHLHGWPTLIHCSKDIEEERWSQISKTPLGKSANAAPSLSVSGAHDHPIPGNDAGSVEPMASGKSIGSILVLSMMNQPLFRWQCYIQWRYAVTVLTSQI